MSSQSVGVDEQVFHHSFDLILLLRELEWNDPECRGWHRKAYRSRLSTKINKNSLTGFYSKDLILELLYDKINIILFLPID